MDSVILFFQVVAFCFPITYLYVQSILPFYLQVRIESTSVLASMLDGHSLTLSQVAEYKESSKCGSFTTLSSSLGQKLMQLHTGA